MLTSTTTAAVTPPPNCSCGGEGVRRGGRGTLYRSSRRFTQLSVLAGAGPMASLVHGGPWHAQHVSPPPGGARRTALHIHTGHRGPAHAHGCVGRGGGATPHRPAYAQQLSP